MTKNDIKTIQSLKQTKCRRQHGVFVVEGTKLINELIDSNFQIHDILITEQWADKNIDFLKKIKGYEFVTQKQMEQMTNFVTAPGILATAAIPSYKISPDDAKGEMVLALDGINDPGNLGTIIRTADWFGIRKIVTSEDCADIWQPKTLQATMGSIFRTMVVEVDLEKFIADAQGVPVYGALMEGENIFNKKMPNAQGIIIIGSESHGIRKNILPFVTESIHIPRAVGSKTESLNAAIAAAIIMAFMAKGV